MHAPAVTRGDPKRRAPAGVAAVAGASQPTTTSTGARWTGASRVGARCTPHNWS